MTCRSMGAQIGVINCGCKGDVDTSIYRCESFDSPTIYCVEIGPATQERVVVLTDGTTANLEIDGCNRCPANTDRRSRNRPKPTETPERPSGGTKWEDIATPKQIAAKKRRHPPESQI